MGKCIKETCIFLVSISSLLLPALWKCSCAVPPLYCDSHHTITFPEGECPFWNSMDFSSFNDKTQKIIFILFTQYIPVLQTETSGCLWILFFWLTLFFFFLPSFLKYKPSSKSQLFYQTFSHLSAIVFNNPHEKSGTEIWLSD